MARMEMDCILKKMRLIFFNFIASVVENSLKLKLWFIFSSKIHLISSSLCSISISCTTKVLSSNLRQFLKNLKNHYDRSPLTFSLPETCKLVLTFEPLHEIL